MEPGFLQPPREAPTVRATVAPAGQERASQGGAARPAEATGSGRDSEAGRGHRGRGPRPSALARSPPGRRRPRQARTGAPDLDNQTSPAGLHARGLRLEDLLQSRRSARGVPRRPRPEPPTWPNPTLRGPLTAAHSPSRTPVARRPPNPRAAATPGRRACALGLNAARRKR